MKLNERDAIKSEICEYRLILTPHTGLRNRIVGIRNDLDVLLGKRVTPELRPHILLAGFKQSEVMEKAILKKLKLVADATSPFIVDLKYFEMNENILFIRVRKNDAIKKLVKSVRSATKGILNIKGDRKPYFTSHPCMQLSLQLKPKQFHKAALRVDKTDFKADFVAMEMRLIKVRHETRSWTLVEAIEFENVVEIIIMEPSKSFSLNPKLKQYN